MPDAPFTPPAPLAHADRAAHAAGDGVRMLPVDTPLGRFEVWTQRVGDSPCAKLLLLHGGPGATHEYFAPLADRLAAAGIEVYLYDQLGSHHSDQPDAPSLWELPRFVDEVEQVRQALGLSADNFFLLGHSWGGILATEYALVHQQHLKGLIISNMVASIPAYNAYARDVLMPAIDPAVLAEIQALEAAKDYGNPRYMGLLMEHHYVHHVLRMPLGTWPEPVERAFAHINQQVYIPMQGPSELGASGKLVDWDRSADIARIRVPLLAIGAAHDTMDPAGMQQIAASAPHGRSLHCPNGSHMAMFDDEAAYFAALLSFIEDVDAGAFASAAA